VPFPDPKSRTWEFFTEANLGPGSAAQRPAAPRPGHVPETREGSLPASFFVYMLASKRNGTLYVGVTNDLARWVTEHKAKLVPGFTRKYNVNCLVYFELFDTVLEARAREHLLKRWRRAWKIVLIEKLNADWHDLSGELNS
jgi:putative endonuclease